MCKLAKLLERAVLPRPSDAADDLNFGPHVQHGFHRDHSTVHQLSRVVDFINNSFNWINYTSVIFLDITKASDRVWHEGLVWKLFASKIPPDLTILIRSYLAEPPDSSKAWCGDCEVIVVMKQSSFITTIAEYLQYEEQADSPIAVL